MNRQTATLLLALVSLLAMPKGAAAQQAEMKVSVDPRVVNVGKTVDFTVEVGIQGNRQMRVESEPDIGEGFQVVGRRRAPSMVIRNGNVQRSLKLTYRLQAVQTGTHTLKSPKFRVGGELVGPKTQEVKVVEDGSSAGQKGESRSKGTKHVRLGYQVEPTKRPYVGQQINLSYHMLVDPHRVNIKPEPPDEPGLDDFWIEDRSQKMAGQSEHTTVDGRLMRKTILRSYALFPLESGSVTVDPMEVTVRKGSSFMGGTERLELASDPIEMTVRPLPEGAPDGFYEGNVGSWNFRVDPKRTGGKVGSPITLRLIADGRGNIRRLELPSVDDLDGFRVADRSEEVETDWSGMSVSGRKVVEYTLVPTRRGKVDFPALAFHFFDPNAERYRTVETDPITFNIRPGELSKSQKAAEAKEKEADQPPSDSREALRNRLRAPYRSSDDVRGAPTTADRILFGFAAGLPLLGLLGLLLGPAVRRRLTALRRRSADSEARERAGELLEEAAAAPPADAPDTIHRALRVYLTDALDIPAGEVTSGDLGARLAAAGVEDETRERLLEVVGWCEENRYAPGQTIGEAARDQTVETCRQAFDTLDRRPSNGAAGQVGIVLSLGTALALGAAPADLAAADSPDWTSALEAHEAGDWQTAADRWSELLNSVRAGKAARAPGDQSGARAASPLNPGDAVLLYNLGTALARQGELGGARLALERAALRAPGDGRIQTNLETVRRLVERERLDRARGPTAGASLEPGLTRWKATATVDVRTLAVGLAVALWLIFLGMAGRRFADDPTYRNTATAVLIAGAVALVGLVAFWAVKSRTQSTVDPAVVASQTATVREAPSRHAKNKKPSLPLVPGTMVRVDEEREGWSKVRLEGGDYGWVKSSAIQSVSAGD